MQKINPQLKQCIYLDHELEELSSLELYLEDRGRYPGQQPSTAYSGVSIQLNQLELLGAEYEFGQLNILKFQWDELLRRLRNSKVGLVCNGRHDAHSAPKLIFEPGSEFTHISIAYFDQEFDLHLPIDGLIGNLKARDLYKHLELNLDQLLQQGNQDYQAHFTRVKYPTPRLHAEIQSASEQIEKLYQKLNQMLLLEFYFDS